MTANGDQIRQILTGLPAVTVETVGPFWRVGVAGLSGARVDGIALAHDLKAQYEWRKSRERQTATESTKPKAAPAPVRDDRDERIARLEALLAAKAAPEPEPVARHIPPPELADLIILSETPAQTHDRLIKLYAEAKGAAELARKHDGFFDGRSTIDWENKAIHFDSGIEWNRGRMAGQV